MTIVDIDEEMEKGQEPPPVVSARAVSIDSMALSKHTDPFATREGKTLTWKNVNMTLVRSLLQRILALVFRHIWNEQTNVFSCDGSCEQAAKGEEPERKLLSDVWGEVPNHCTTAVMGPSGAGYVGNVIERSICHSRNRYLLT